MNRRGGADPTYRGDSRLVWRTSQTPEGPGTVRIALRSATEVRYTAWGPGAEWLAAVVPDWLGARDDLDGFHPDHPGLDRVARRLVGWRLGRTGRVMEALVPAILEQKVTGRESVQAWRWLVERYGEIAPGPTPTGMRVPPTGRDWALIPSWDWHRAGVGPERAATIIRCARVADHMEEVLALTPEDAEGRLRAVPGVGVWTAAEVMQRAAGAADMVSFGDLHVGRHVVWAMTGELVARDRADDRMAELLEPYRPHRYRVQRLIELSGARPPRRGPRYRPLDHRRR